MTDTATLKTPADVRGDVARIVQRELFAAESPWPRTIHIPWPKETQLVADVAGVHAPNNALKEFAARFGCQTDFISRKMGTAVSLVAHIHVPDEATALAIAGPTLRRPRERVLARAAQLEQRCHVDHALAMDVVRRLNNESDVDFGLFVEAAQWFGRHWAEVPGLTAREIPLPGFSAKWLAGSRSRRRAAICTVLGVDRLPLRERPGEVRYRYMDQRFAAEPDRVATSVQCVPERPVSLAVIVENKDTYQAMGPIDGAVCVFGSGFAVNRVPELLPWLAGDGVRVVYWGDIDAAGFEILSGLRASGVACESVLMDRMTYAEYERFGTTRDAASHEIRCGEPKHGLHLSPEEYALYRDLCTRELAVPRIEQERIPIAEFMRLISAGRSDGSDGARADQCHSQSLRTPK